MNNEINSVIDEDVATMLPTVGLNGSVLTKDNIVHTENDIDEDIKNKEENEKITEREDRIMQNIEFSEAVINYMSNPDAEYDEFVAEGVFNIVNKVKERVVVSKKTCKLVVYIHMLKKKIDRMEKSGDKRVTDYKRDLIQKQKELNHVKKTASPELRKEIAKIEKDLEKKTPAINFDDLKTESNENNDISVESVSENIAITEKEEEKTLPPELKRLDEIRGQIENLTDDLKKAKAQFDSTGEKIYENKVKGLTAKIDKLKKELAEKEKEAKKIQDEAVKESSEIISEAEHLVRLEDRINYWTQFIKEMKEKIAKKEKEVDKTTFADSIKQLTNEISELKIKLKDSEKSLAKLEDLKRSGGMKPVYASTDDVEIDNEVVTEAANMEDEIKPIVSKLESKGYKVKYASPGHKKLRKKEDAQPDGVYYSKLYSDARVMFDKKYSFSNAPKYWHWRDVDGCSYLDITPIAYDKNDGTPDEAFAKWKDNYMDSLRSFVDELKSNGDKEVKESVDEFANSFMEELFEKMGFDELGLDSCEIVTESASNDNVKDLIEELDNLLA